MTKELKRLMVKVVGMFDQSPWDMDFDDQGEVIYAALKLAEKRFDLTDPFENPKLWAVCSAIHCAKCGISAEESRPDSAAGMLLMNIFLAGYDKGELSLEKSD